MEWARHIMDGMIPTCPESTRSGSGEGGANCRDQTNRRHSHRASQPATDAGIEPNHPPREKRDRERESEAHDGNKRIFSDASETRTCKPPRRSFRI
jgi:hypothetical protein